MRRRLAARWVRAVGPVIPVTLFGAVWIAAHAAAGRAGTHTQFQILALAECTIALLLRGRKPVGALAGIVAVYAPTELLAPAPLVAVGLPRAGHRLFRDGPTRPGRAGRHAGIDEATARSCRVVPERTASSRA